MTSRQKNHHTIDGRTVVIIFWDKIVISMGNLSHIICHQTTTWCHNIRSTQIWSSLVEGDEGWIGLSKKLLCLC